MKRFFSSGGFSLIELMVVLAITGIAATAAIRVFELGLKANKHVEIKGDLEQVREYVRAGIGCAATFAALPRACTVGAPDDFIPVFGKTTIGSTGPSLFIKPYKGGTATGFGLYYLRARCDTTPAGKKALFISVKRAFTAAGPSLDDPLTKTSYNWFDLFRGLPPLCHEFLGGSPNPQVELQTGTLVAGPVNATCGGLTGATITGPVSARPWSGVAACRAGYYAVSAGAYVFAPALIAAAQAPYGGTIQAIQPASAVLGSFLETVCVYTNQSVPAGTQALGTLWVTCVRKD